MSNSGVQILCNSVIISRFPIVLWITSASPLSLMPKEERFSKPLWDVVTWLRSQYSRYQNQNMFYIVSYVHLVLQVNDCKYFLYHWLLWKKYLQIQYESSFYFVLKFQYIYQIANILKTHCPFHQNWVADPSYQSFFFFFHQQKKDLILQAFCMYLFFFGLLQSSVRRHIVFFF